METVLTFRSSIHYVHVHITLLLPSINILSGRAMSLFNLLGVEALTCILGYLKGSETF